MKQFRSVSAAALALCLSATIASADECTFNVTNQSVGQWLIKVQYFDGTIIPARSRQGNACVNGPECPASDGCMLEPTCGFYYTVQNDSGGVSGNITFTPFYSGRGESQTFQFSYISRYTCSSHIYHGGRTGGVYLNEPNDGDTTIGGAQW